MSAKENDRLKIAIFVYPEVEELDTIGPLEVFGAYEKYIQPNNFEVFTVAAGPGPVSCANGLSLNPARTFADCPAPDALVIPGGSGTRKLLGDRKILDWIRRTTGRAEAVLSVCTGSLLLARAGLLKGLKATTHYQCYDELRGLEPHMDLAAGERFVDNGKIITAAGVSAGIDAALYLLARLKGQEAARITAEEIEYEPRC